MQSDGQPQVAAAQEGVAEQNAEAGGVEDAEPGGVGIAAVQRGEQGAHGEDGGVRSPDAQQHLKTEAAEQDLFSRRAGQQARRP